MLGSRQIRVSDGYYTINGFDYIVAVANAMKSCHIFRASHDGYLYGTPEEGYSLHRVVLLPQFVPPVDVLFRLDSIDRDIVEKHKNFLYFPNSIDWVMIPEQLFQYAENYHQELVDNIWYVVNEYGVPDPEVIELYKPESDKAVFIPALDKAITGFYSVMNGLTEPPITLTGLESDPIVQAVATTKVSQGRRFLYVPTEKQYYGMHIFRNLFNLNKGDGLSLVIHQRRDRWNLFIAEYLVARKTNPIKDKLQEYGCYESSNKFIIDILVHYMNIQ